MYHIKLCMHLGLRLLFLMTSVIFFFYFVLLPNNFCFYFTFFALLCWCYIIFWFTFVYKVFFLCLFLYCMVEMCERRGGMASCFVSFFFIKFKRWIFFRRFAFFTFCIRMMQLFLGWLIDWLLFSHWIFLLVFCLNFCIGNAFFFRSA